MADVQLAQRFRLALDMYEFGEHIVLARLRRHYPDATEDEVTRMIGAWRTQRPGAPGGDAPGRASRRFG